MSATANPHFDMQHQAMMSLKRIHQICLGLQFMQVLASALVLTMGYLAPPLHLYGAMLYFFMAVFSHVVVYYVVLSIGNNVRDAYTAHPESVQEWLVYATARVKNRILPFLLIHLVVLISLLGAAISVGLSNKQPPLHHIGAIGAALTGLVAAARVYFALRDNTDYLTAFVMTGGVRMERGAVDV